MDRRDWDLNSAIKQGDIDQVRKLLEDGADPNKTNTYGTFPLFIAILNKQFKIFELLLKHSDINVNQANSYGYTVLIHAAHHGYTDVVKLLLNHQNIDVNQANNNGYTALNWAAYKGHIDVVKLLLKRKDIDVNQANNDGETALYWAAYYNYTNVVKLLLKRKDIDVNQANNKGKTALYWAAFYGRIEIIKLLLERKDIDVNQADNDGETALNWAAYRHCDEVVKLLIDEYIKRGIQLSPTESDNQIIKELYGKRICEEMNKLNQHTVLGILRKRVDKRIINHNMAKQIIENLKETGKHANPQTCIDWYNRYLKDMKGNSSSGNKRRKVDITHDDDGMELSDDDLPSLSNGGYRNLNGMNKKHKPHLVKKSNGAKKTRTTKKSHRMKKSNGVKKTSHTKTPKRKKPIRKHPIRKTPTPPLRRKNPIRKNRPPHLQHHI